MFLAPRNNDTTAEFSVTQSQSTLAPSGYLSTMVILWWFLNFLLTGFPYLPARRNAKLPKTIRLFQLKKLIMKRTHHYNIAWFLPSLGCYWPFNSDKCFRPFQDFKAMNISFPPCSLMAKRNEFPYYTFLRFCIECKFKQ